MELNWSTFALEIVNFLVLVWILKRFLYRPVLEVIERRRTAIAKRMSEAEELQAKAEALREQYERRLADWEQERTQARQTALQEVDAERARQLQALQTTLAQEREKLQVAEQRRQRDAARKLETAALAQAGQFAARLLTALASPELEARLVALALTELARLPAERATALRTTWGQPATEMVIASAYPLTEADRERLVAALTGVAGGPLPVRFERDPALLAGLRISAGAWVLGANLRDELSAFSEFAHATD